MRLSAVGVEALDALLRGSVQLGTDALERRLVAAGMLLREPGLGSLADLTVVVPVRGSIDDVRVVLDGVPDGVAVVVVDDGSREPLAGRLAGVEVIRHERSLGPAAARNAGAACVQTRLVAFVDAEVTLPAGALEKLSGHFVDDRVVAVAPRVLSAAAPGLAGVLEQQLCALDRGPIPAEVHRRGPVSYVPSTVLLVRTSVLHDVGGFDEQLVVGEDVDLVWRLSEQGVVRYDPSVAVHHRPRARLLPALRRRRDYGASAGPLDRRHPHQVRHLRVSLWSLAPWAAAAVHPLLGVATAAGLVISAPRAMPALPPVEARRVALAGQWASFGAIGRYAVRPALPFTLAAAVTSHTTRRLLPVLAAAHVAGSSPRLRNGPLRDLPARAVLHVLDDLAYSAGVWRGAVSARRWRVLMPALAPPRATVTREFPVRGWPVM